MTSVSSDRGDITVWDLKIFHDKSHPVCILKSNSDSCLGLGWVDTVIPLVMESDSSIGSKNSKSSSSKSKSSSSSGSSCSRGSCRGGGGGGGGGGDDELNVYQHILSVGKNGYLQLHDLR